MVQVQMSPSGPFQMASNTKRREAYDIGTIMKRSPVKGRFGLEIECEGNKFQKENIPSMWVYHNDGSLRGKDNAEYVLNRPLEFEAIQPALDALWGMFDKYGTKLDDSNRTSVHVHLNVQRFHLNRLAAFCAMFFALEELLTEWCGDHRVGNLFCLRAKDAPAIVTCFKRYIQRGGAMKIYDGMHYAGLNPQALEKFGSLEVRTMRGVSDPQIIMDWVGMLNRIYEKSAEFPDPRDVVSNFSGTGPIEFAEMVLGPQYFSTIRQNIDFDDYKVKDSIYEGIQFAQDICYCYDWSTYEPKESEFDPFGRIRKTSPPWPTSLDDYMQEYTPVFDNHSASVPLFSATETYQTMGSAALNELYPNNAPPAPSAPAPYPDGYTLAQLEATLDDDDEDNWIPDFEEDDDE